MKPAVYRFFNADGILLYVGMTANPFKRLHQHQIETKWADEIVRVDIQYVDYLPQARTLEQKIIKDEHPLYNVHWNVGRWNKCSGFQLVKRV